VPRKLKKLKPVCEGGVLSVVTKTPGAKPAKKRKPRAKKATAAERPAASSTRSRRLDHKRKAAEAIERHSGPVLSLLVDVIGDLNDEVGNESQVEQDLAWAGELAHRLDRAVKLNDPLLEALDGIVLFFVAAAAVGIYRAIEGSNNRKVKRLARLKERLAKLGPSMSSHMRRNLERRIKRLEG